MLNNLFATLDYIEICLCIKNYTLDHSSTLEQGSTVKAQIPNLRYRRLHLKVQNTSENAHLGIRDRFQGGVDLALWAVDVD